MDEASPARLYCLLVGGGIGHRRDHRLLLRGELRHRGSIRTEDVFGVLSVNGWHNLVHIAIGALLLVCADPPRAAPRSSSASSTSSSAFWASSPPGTEESTSWRRTTC